MRKKLSFCNEWWWSHIHSWNYQFCHGKQAWNGYKQVFFFGQVMRKYGNLACVWVCASAYLTIWKLWNKKKSFKGFLSCNKILGICHVLIFYLLLRYSDGVTWHDVACYRKKPFACEDSDVLMRRARAINPAITLWTAKGAEATKKTTLKTFSVDQVQGSQLMALSCAMWAANNGRVQCEPQIMDLCSVSRKKNRQYAVRAA